MYINYNNNINNDKYHGCDILWLVTVLSRILSSLHGTGVQPVYNQLHHLFQCCQLVYSLQVALLVSEDPFCTHTPATATFFLQISN